MREFTNAHVRNHGAIAGAGSLVVDAQSDLVDAPLTWQKQGLQQTASGYGRNLTSRYKILFEGKLRRLYYTCYSNVSSTFFKFKGRTIYVN